LSEGRSNLNELVTCVYTNPIKADREVGEAERWMEEMEGRTEKVADLYL
jgi:hypothetical protein